MAIGKLDALREAATALKASRSVAHTTSTWGWLGTVTGAMAVISTARRIVVDVWNLSLNASFDGFLQFYRENLAFLLGWTHWLGLDLPDWYHDLFVLNALVAVAAWRAQRDANTFVTSFGQAVELRGRVPWWGFAASVPLLASWLFLPLSLKRIAILATRPFRRAAALRERAERDEERAREAGFDAYDAFRQSLRDESRDNAAWDARDRAALVDQLRLFFYLAVSLLLATCAYVWAIYSA
ncbi:MAG: hypothetical protein KDE15_14325 [Erythrobacter sp.]|nr:hypothetical protein [Erythrobacter sp.]